MSPTGEPGSRDDFADLMARLDQAMIVVTVATADERDGCLVGFHCQCSIDPPRYLVLLSVANRTHRLAREADVLGVHLLGAGQIDVARHFGEITADDGVDKLAGVRWKAVDGAPVLADPPSAFTGRIRERRPMGDHTAHVLDPITVVRTGPAPPLRFEAVRDLDAGHPA